MRFPFMSTRHHDEVVAELRLQITERDSRLAAAEQDRRQLLDYVAERGIGSPIYRQQEKPEILPPAKVEPPPPANEVEAAIQVTGSRNPRVILRAIEQKKEAEFLKEEAARRQTVDALTASLDAGRARAAQKPASA